MCYSPLLSEEFFTRASPLVHFHKSSFPRIHDFYPVPFSYPIPILTFPTTRNLLTRQINVLFEVDCVLSSSSSSSRRVHHDDDDVCGGSDGSLVVYSYCLLNSAVYTIGLDDVSPRRVIRIRLIRFVLVGKYNT